MKVFDLYDKLLQKKSKADIVVELRNFKNKSKNNNPKK